MPGTDLTQTFAPSLSIHSHHWASVDCHVLWAQPSPHRHTAWGRDAPHKSFNQIGVGEKGSLSEIPALSPICWIFCLAPQWANVPRWCQRFQSSMAHAGGGSLDHPGCPGREASSLALVLLLGTGKSASGTCWPSDTFPDKWKLKESLLHLNICFHYWLCGPDWTPASAFLSVKWAVIPAAQKLWRQTDGPVWTCGDSDRRLFTDWKIRNLAVFVNLNVNRK